MKKRKTKLTLRARHKIYEKRDIRYVRKENKECAPINELFSSYPGGVVVEIKPRRTTDIEWEIDYACTPSWHRTVVWIDDADECARYELDKIRTAACGSSCYIDILGPIREKYGEEVVAVGMKRQFTRQHIPRFGTLTVCGTKLCFVLPDEQEAMLFKLRWG